MISPKYLIYHDLIGFHSYAKLKSRSKNKDFQYIGMVIDESCNMLITENNKEIKKYIKKDYIFRFKLNEEFLEVDGVRIIGNPINRLRSLKKKKRI